MIVRLKRRWKGAILAITLMEVVFAMAVGGLLMAGVASGFIQCMRQAEWSSYSLAANSLALQKLEQTRAAAWDRLAAPPNDQVVSSNFPPDVQVLDVPISKTNIVYATNFTSIQSISTNPPLKLVRVDCVWSFMSRGLFTNTLATYRAPNQ
jgi:hypothetical protein